ncbi:hypothetical protein Q5P01_016466 [Channa striata]|uniref:Uncharacterized protein n=1 Tax=Channa striata TaxID=64152 RepID=A0AA88MH14_CHASR|nr:hypothetical protein Q5P01_016466 [Channa striata]
MKLFKAKEGERWLLGPQPAATHVHQSQDEDAAAAANDHAECVRTPSVDGDHGLELRPAACYKLLAFSFRAAKTD